MPACRGITSYNVGSAETLKEDGERHKEVDSMTLHSAGRRDVHLYMYNRLYGRPLHSSETRRCERYKMYLDAVGDGIKGDVLTNEGRRGWGGQSFSGVGELKWTGSSFVLEEERLEFVFKDCKAETVKEM